LRSQHEQKGHGGHSPFHQLQTCIMKNIFSPIIFLLVLAAIFDPTGAMAQYQQPGYSILTTSKAQMKSDVWIDGQLKVINPITLPKLTTTQRNALTAAEGMFIYNTTIDSIQYRNASAWVTAGGGDDENFWMMREDALTPKPGPSEVFIGVNDSVFLFVNREYAFLSTETDTSALTIGVSKNQASITSELNGSQTGKLQLSDTGRIRFYISGSSYYEFPRDTGRVGDVLVVASNDHGGGTVLHWGNGIAEQSSLTAQNDTTGMAAEIEGSDPNTYATIVSLIARVAELENRLQLVGILPEDE